jgi:hypothetical protein
MVFSTGRSQTWFLWYNLPPRPERRIFHEIMRSLLPGGSAAEQQRPTLTGKDFYDERTDESP